jgi:predicted amidohydrolase YtcJ
VNHDDDQSGSIEVGKRADLVVLDRNLFTAPVTELSDACVDLTLASGRVVFERR